MTFSNTVITSELPPACGHCRAVHCGRRSNLYVLAETQYVTRKIVEILIG
jgi:hypothetical protein